MTISKTLSFGLRYSRLTDVYFKRDAAIQARLMALAAFSVRKYSNKFGIFLANSYLCTDETKDLDICAGSNGADGVFARFTKRWGQW